MPFKETSFTCCTRNVPGIFREPEAAVRAWGSAFLRGAPENVPSWEVSQPTGAEVSGLRKRSGRILWGDTVEPLTVSCADIL